MTTIFCIHPKGFNVGNDVIRLGLLHLLYQAFGKVVNLVSLPAVSHFESHSKAGLSASTIHEINQYGSGVIVGGGNLYENGQLTVNVDALEMLAPPMLLMSLSRGRIYDRHGRLVNRTDVMPDRVIRALNHKAAFSLARDRATYDHLLQLGCDRVRLGGCPTVYLDKVRSQLPTLPAGERPGVLLSVRNPSLMNIPLGMQARVRDDVSRLIGFLRDQNIGEVRLLCHDHRDIPFAATFQNIDYVFPGDVYSYLSLLQSCKLNVTYRLHAALPCMSLGTPSINISYDERCESLFDTLGLGEWNINMMTCGDVVAQVRDRYRRRAELAPLIARARNIWRELYDVNLTTLREFASTVESFEQEAPLESRHVDRIEGPHHRRGGDESRRTSRDCVSVD
jgi:hypothetical protein